MIVKKQLFAAVAAPAIVFGSLSAQADQPEDVPGDWRFSLFGVENCVGALQNTGNELTSASDCAVEQVFSYLAESALQFVEQHGKASFGEHFHIDRRLGLTASSGTLSADLDVVVPLTSLSSEDDALTRSFFMQNGVTRWRDAQGFERSDVRLGFVHRYALFEKPGDGVLGTSMFVQENLERGHTRIVTGFEYLDRWGQGSLNYYAPGDGLASGALRIRGARARRGGAQLRHGLDQHHQLQRGRGPLAEQGRHGRVGRSGPSRHRLAAASVV